MLTAMTSLELAQQVRTPIHGSLKGPCTRQQLTRSTLGYIGGSAHAAIARAHPDWDITLLVRNEERGKPIKEAYPKSKFVYGSLDDADVVQKAAAEADVVVREYTQLRFAAFY